jgi:hypothetical protein
MASADALLAPWLVGEGIVTYRCVRNQHRPPMPGELLASSGAFVLLALLAQWQANLATLIAWGLDIAAFVNIAPQLLAGPGPTPATTTAATGGAAAAGSNLHRGTPALGGPAAGNPATSATNAAAGGAAAAAAGL